MQQPQDNYGQGPVIGGPDHRPAQPPQRPARAPEMTPEEQRIFKECNRESYFQRSLPASLLLGGLAFIGVRRGILTPHPRFGPTPKMIGAAIVGYFFGKVSYMETCRQKFLTELPNSNIAMAIRKARGEESFYEEQPRSTDESEVFDQRPDQDSQSLNIGSESGEGTEQKKRLSYDDLRDQHRKGQRSPLTQQPAGLMSPSRQAPPSLMPPDDGWAADPSIASRSGGKRTNKYGDEGFE